MQATGCGKTHTISGTPEDPGVIFLTMKELYERIELSREDSEVQVRLSYLEIYNESIRDLLSPSPTPPGQGLMLREDATRKISVVGITEHVPESPERVLEMIQEGNLRRTMSPTEANAVSSRSHAVLQINVTQRPRTAGTITETTSASLNIIDLAGSERASATRNNGVRMKEGANINKSLLALGNCINALCQSGGQRLKHVPYRNSKLTRLLKFSLGGNCKTVMIVCVSPSSAHYDETHNTLKYANQAKNIRTKVSRNMLNVDRHVAQYVQAIHELRQEVLELKAKLAEKGSTENVAEKKREAEVLKGVQDTKARLRSSTNSIIQLIKSHAGVEAQMEIAASRLTTHQQTLNSIDTQLQCADPQDIERLLVMKEVYRRLEAKEDAILQDQARLSAYRSLSNSIEMHRSSTLAACRNTLFDEEAVDTIRVYGDCMIAEMNAVRNEINYEAAKSSMDTQGIHLDLMAEAKARSDSVLKQVAMQIDSTIASGIDMANPILALLPLVRDARDKNDKVLADLQGSTLRSGTRERSAKTSFTLRQTTSNNRHTFASFAKRSVAGTSNKALYPMSSPKKIKLRRSSVGPRRRNMPGSITVKAAPVRSVSNEATSAPKKSFRWADEAGEGKLDNHNHSSSLTIPLEGLSSSSAADETAASDPDSSLLHKPSYDLPEQALAVEQDKTVKIDEAITRPAKREGGGIFERNFLSKKEAKRDISASHEETSKVLNRAPLSDMSNEAGDASISSSDDSLMHPTSDLNTTSARSSPYQRRSSQLGPIRRKARSSLSEVGGPIRRPQNTSTLHRVAIGAPSFTASRSSRASNITSTQIRNGAAHSSPAPSHHTSFRPNSSIGNSSGTAWR